MIGATTLRHFARGAVVGVVAVVVLALLLPLLGGSAPVRAFAYDLSATPVSPHDDGGDVGASDQRLLRLGSPGELQFHGYDTSETIARASSRLDGYRLAPQTAGFFGGSLDDLSAAASVPGKGDFTVAGHALTKHAAGQRAGSGAFPSLRGGPAQINELAQFQVDDILTYPGSRFAQRSHPTFGDVLEVIAPDGRGARFGSDGRFIGFLEPPR